MSCLAKAGSFQLFFGSNSFNIICMATIILLSFASHYTFHEINSVVVFPAAKIFVTSW